MRISPKMPYTHRAFCLPMRLTTYWEFWAVKNHAQLNAAARKEIRPATAKMPIIKIFSIRNGLTEIFHGNGA